MISYYPLQTGLLKTINTKNLNNWFDLKLQNMDIYMSINCHTLCNLDISSMCIKGRFKNWILNNVEIDTLT